MAGRAELGPAGNKWPAPPRPPLRLPALVSVLHELISVVVVIGCSYYLGVDECTTPPLANASSAVPPPYTRYTLQLDQVYLAEVRR